MITKILPSNASVIHVVPAMNIGGVEVAVSRSMPEIASRFQYEIFSVKGEGVLATPVLETRDFVRRLLGRNKPQVVVSSLWPSHPFGMISRAMGVPWLPFFHAAHAEGFHRDVVIRMAARLSKARLCDSVATAEYLRVDRSDSTFICPYIFGESTKLQKAKPKDLDFIFSGRVSSEKRLDLVLKFLELWTKGEGTSKSALVLGGSSSIIEEFSKGAKSRGLDLEIHANVTPSAVAGLYKRARFYLCLSDYEGFSASTIEAIQNGCIPVVRPVGEIAKYVDIDAGVLIHAESEIVSAVTCCRWLVENPEFQLRLVNKAQANISRYPDYVSSFVNAVALAYSLH